MIINNVCIKLKCLYIIIIHEMIRLVNGYIYIYVENIKMFKYVEHTLNNYESILQSRE